MKAQKPEPLKPQYICGCLVPIALMLALVLAGCGEYKRTTEEANLLSAAYKKAMKAGKTTPDQDKRHIEAMDAEILAIDSAVRGTKKAKATRALVEEP